MMNENSLDLALQFEAIVGAKYVLRDEGEMAPYMTEWRDRYQGKALCVVLPGSTEEISELIKLANTHQFAIVPQGGNTGLVGGQICDQSGQQVVVALQRLNRIREIDAQNGHICVEAGVPLAEVQEQADRAGFLFPLSLASEGSCQIGGNIATNAGGVHVLRYGNMRRMVQGLEVVLGDGRIWSNLGSLHKDNTGYDLKQIFIGSEGTLGIITAASLQLFPKFKSSVQAFIGAESLEKIGEFFSVCRQTMVGQVNAFEVFSRLALEFSIDFTQGAKDPLTHSYPWYVLLEVAGDNEGKLRSTLEENLGSAIETDLILDAVITQSLGEGHALWALRENMSEAQKPQGGSIKHDISVPVSLIPEFIEAANERVEEIIPGARPVPFGHYGDGNIHYNISQPLGADRDEFLGHWERLSEAVYALVIDFNGSISAEHGIGVMKRDLLADVKSEVEMDMMRSIKQAFDPRGVLNPGKLL